MIKTYLLHHRDFVNRFKYITTRLDEENIEYDVIDGYHPRTINYDELMVGYEKFIPIIVEFGPPGLTNYHSYRNFSKRISPGSVSLNLKHIHAWKDQIENDYDFSLILEDDAEIPVGFGDTLNRIVSEFTEAQSDGIDMIMIGDGYDWHTPVINPTKCTHHHPCLKTRCTHAYLLNKKFAKIMLDNFTSMNLPIDFKMNEIIQLKSIKVSWYEPGIKQKPFINENTLIR